MPSELGPLLAMTSNPVQSQVEYVVGGLHLAGADREAAAQLIADTAMTIACGASPALGRWRGRRDGGPAAGGAAGKAVSTFVGLAFGNPAHPANEDHVQGHVAELVWNLLIRERLVTSDGRRLVKAHSVKADPLEPGGDGLVIYLDPGDVLVFRLWEIKKHVAQAVVSGTINRASKQLADRGAVYLAKLAAPETMLESGALGELYANLVEYWFDRSERAGVGVAVGTSDTHAPSSHRSFGSLNTAFPEFTRVGQTEAIVIALPDFPAFADRVKEIMWSGL